MTARAVALAAAAALAGCVALDADVLTVGPVLADCMAVLGRASDQQACGFAGVCSWPAATDPTCCQVLAICERGTLAIEQYCDPSCRTCAADRECPVGVAVCDGDACVACPDPTTCAPCAAGTTPVARNGCATCLCAPPSECGGDPAGPGGCAVPGETCYPGLVCADGCGPGDPSCCANVCAADGCPVPAPLGCDTRCPPELGCQECVTGACECGAGQWTCTPICAPMTGRCFQP